MAKCAAYHASGTRRRHHAKIRLYRKVKAFRKGGKPLLQATLAEAALQTEHPEDLVNIAIEELIRQSYELPGFTTLVKEAQKQRKKTYTRFYQQITAGLTVETMTFLDALLVLDPHTQRSRWDRLKDPTGKPTLKNLKVVADRLTWFDPYQPCIELVAALPEAKRRHFADEALAYDIGTMTDIKPPRRYTLACVLLAQRYAQTLDDLAELFIKRIRAIQHDAREALQTYHQQQQARTDSLVRALRDIVLGYQQHGTIETRFSSIDDVLQGRSEGLLQDCEAHLTYAGNNFAPFMWKFYASHRPTLIRLLKLLPLRSSSSDTKLEQAIHFMLTHARTRNEWIPLHQKGVDAVSATVQTLDISWLPVGWWRLVTDLPTRDQIPVHINRRHFESCVVSQLLTALNAGDLYLAGADRFGDPLPRLITWDDYHARIGTYADHLGFASDPTLFVREQQDWLSHIAAQTDQAFPANTYVTIHHGRPKIKRQRRRPDPPGLKELKRKLADLQRPTRSILEALADTEHWLGWSKHFGPLSGFSSKLANALEYYLTTVFCYGTAIGPSATARAIGNLDRRQISRIDQYHIAETDLDAAIETIIAHYQQCSLPSLWGSLSHASIDGTKWEVYEQNLLSEQHIRYGGYGGIALHLLSSTYIALMVNLITCSAWEGHYLLDVLEQNQSVIQPTTIHADTQGQNEAIFGLAFLRGITLMPRIRNWQNLILYRPDPDAVYDHIETIFSKKAIDWALIQQYMPDLLRIALSIKEGCILPSTILRTISAGTSKLAQACRELGRARRTGFLLRFMTEVDLRTLIHKETNKTEKFHAFSKWFGFGSAGIIRENERPAQQKALKYNLLLANAMMFHNTVMLSNDLRTLIRQGYYVDPACVAVLSPYVITGFERFGRYTLSMTNVPDPIDYTSPVVSDRSGDHAEL